MKSIIYGSATYFSTIVVMSLAAQQAAAQESWKDDFSFSGDLRPRYEYIDSEEATVRPRERFRVRLGAAMEVNQNVEVIVRLASGGDNPVSTNESFDGGFTRKPIGIDLAYADWTINEDVHLLVGKVRNPLHRAGGHALIWDSDLNPEGVAVSYESGILSGTAGTYFVEERSSMDDSMLLAVQGGVKFDVGSAGELSAGLGYHAYTEMKGNQPLWLGVPFGNSVDEDGNLLYDYRQVEVYGEFATSIGELPVSFFANYVKNTEVDDNDIGYAFGAKVGKAGEPGTWQASWAWQELQADAVVALFTDSDFGGGGTDSRGHTIKARYALADNWAVGGTLFVNEVNLASGMPKDYTRLQVDLEFDF